MTKPKYQFFSAFPSAHRPIPADKSALSTMPISAYRHCEAMRQAASHGWYIFPPTEIQLLSDGAEVMIAHGDDWIPLIDQGATSEYMEKWNLNCPPELQDKAPNFVSLLFGSKIVQIWTGLFVKSPPGWSALIRPLSNINFTNAFTCFEGVVDAYSFAPMPLFVNITLNVTNRPILISESTPLFQLQPVLTDSYSMTEFTVEDFTSKEFDWDATKDTMRIRGVSENRKSVGQYGAHIRRNMKKR